MSKETLHLTFEHENQKQFGPCDCCGEFTERIWGYIYRGESALAAYFVEWTPGHPDTAANFDLVIGRWGEETTSSDRVAVSLEFRHLENGPAFMVIDPDARPVSRNSLVGKALNREEVLSGDIRETAFDLVDLVYLDDPRINTLRKGD